MFIQGQAGIVHNIVNDNPDVVSLFAFTQRISADTTNVDGTVTKTNVLSIRSLWNINYFLRPETGLFLMKSSNKICQFNIKKLIFQYSLSLLPH